jgi:RNA polymerase sigma factor (TIGR02999 family)
MPVARESPLPPEAVSEGVPAHAPGSSDALFTSLYHELHRLARREAARAGPGAVLSATTIIHEVYLDMSQRDALAFPDRGRFLAYAARAMRAVVIDRARASGAQKRGGGLDITSLDTETAESVAEPGLFADIGAALDELAALEPALANVVDLKFFCGFSVAEIAALQGVSERTVQRQWEKARLLLYRALGSDE